VEAIESNRLGGRFLKLQSQTEAAQSCYEREERGVLKNYETRYVMGDSTKQKEEKGGKEGIPHLKVFEGRAQIRTTYAATQW